VSRLGTTPSVRRGYLPRRVTSMLSTKNCPCSPKTNQNLTAPNLRANASAPGCRVILALPDASSPKRLRWAVPLRQRTQVHVSGSDPSCSNQTRTTGLASLVASAPAGVLQGEPGLLSGAASLAAKIPFGTPMLVCSFAPGSGRVLGALR
jgi:hypothetical protein